MPAPSPKFKGKAQVEGEGRAKGKVKKAKAKTREGIQPKEKARSLHPVQPVPPEAWWQVVVAGMWCLPLWTNPCN